MRPFFCNFVNNYDEGMEYVAALSDNRIGLILDFLNMELSHEDDRDLRPLVPMSCIRISLITMKLPGTAMS